MTTRYRVDPARGRLTVQAFATGMLSILGHSPTFAARVFSGVVRLDDPARGGVGVDLTVRADSLALLDQVKAADREEIEGRMRREVLEAAAFPEIAFETVEAEADEVGQGRYRAFLGGRLTLHGVSQRLGIDAEMTADPDAVRLRGGSTIRMSLYRIRPVTALGGAIKLKDELSVSFDLVGLPEGRT
jgi:polyisoprenoid-binding protein YceI